METEQSYDPASQDNTTETLIKSIIIRYCNVRYPSKGKCETKNLQLKQQENDECYDDNDDDDDDDDAAQLL